MELNEIRQKFLDYFKENGHTVITSSSLVPHNDNTLLFTNAGMNQFKNVFLGLEKQPYTRAVTVQKCVRAGGKHNDLENVGYTARHHTFFEMLGNFSFGDYFKVEALSYAWEFLTVVLKIPADKLYVTVYHTDDEAYNVWHNTIGLSKERIIRIGNKKSGEDGSDNFWQMGDTGPCGPCSEIFYDHGPDVEGGLPGSLNEDGDRYIEIWNCVFMQFNRDSNGVLIPLPKPSVDTGMGLERISAIMQHVQNNYDIDIFKALILSASKLTGCRDLKNVSLKVLSDHVRSVSFLIADGVLPSNEGRGYVLRRIIRRAIRHSYKLGIRKPIFYKLVNELVAQMNSAYPELINDKDQIMDVVFKEEKSFFQTIDNGMILLDTELAKVKDNLLDGNIAFKLYDTYGFPLDLTQDVCREKNIDVDIANFDLAMEKQKSMARQSGKFKMNEEVYEYLGKDTEFIHSVDTDTITAKILAIYVKNKLVDKIDAGEEGSIILDKTMFYAESGGQVGDIGKLNLVNNNNTSFIVVDTQKLKPQVIGHFGKLIYGNLKVGDLITATFDLPRRLDIARNHSATHLLHKALHEVLGTHAIQKGSLVSPEYTRFDFAHNKPLTINEIKNIEQIVNHIIRANYVVSENNINYNEAIKQGVTALFDGKYGDTVRVIKMGDFSTELCGGTHVTRTGDIGLFVIISEVGIANGIRRIEAVTGARALQTIQNNHSILTDLQIMLKAQTNEIIIDKVSNVLKENKSLTKELGTQKNKLLAFEADKLITKIETLPNKLKLLNLELKDIEPRDLMILIENLKSKIDSGIIIIGCRNFDKVNLIVGVTKDLVTTYPATMIINYLAGIFGGKGGGRPDLAQAGSSSGMNISEILAMGKSFISKLKNSY